jgi:hypothetical protein
MLRQRVYGLAQGWEVKLKPSAPIFAQAMRALGST